jgi:hypothetical protein
MEAPRITEIALTCAMRRVFTQEGPHQHRSHILAVPLQQTNPALHFQTDVTPLAGALAGGCRHAGETDGLVRPPASDIQETAHW